MNNKSRMQRLARELSEIGYEPLSLIITEIIVTCPEYAAKEVSPHEFANDMSDVMHGLAYKNLTQFVDDNEESLRARKIAAQAQKVKTSLFVSQGFVFITKPRS